MSQNIAEQMKQWLPAVIQAVKPYFSPEDIAKGSRWASEIAKELELSKIGIFCITRTNINAPWMLFEAGAISKSIDKSHVCPLLFGLEPTDLTGPFTQFQAAPFNKLEMLKIVKTINSGLESGSLTSEVLESVFEMWWPKLEDSIRQIMDAANEDDDEALRSDRDLLEEILLLSRKVSMSTSRIVTPRSLVVHPGAVADLVTRVHDLAFLGDFNSCTAKSFAEAFAPLQYIVGRTRFPRGDSERYSDMLEKAREFLRSFYLPEEKDESDEN